MPAQREEKLSLEEPAERTSLLDRVLEQKGILLALATVAVIALVGIAVTQLSREVSYDDVLDALEATPWSDVGLAVAMTALSFLALSIYDVTALRHIGRKLPYGVVAVTSFCAYAVGNIAGFGPLTGGAIRYRFYTPMGLEPEEVGKVIGFVTAAFGLGLSAVTALGFLASAGEVADLAGVPNSLLEGVGVVILLGFVALLWQASRGAGTISIFGYALRLPRPRVLLAQLLAAAVDIAASAAVLWFLLPDGGPGLPAFIAIYAVAVGLGVLSHVPAGLGVFETVIIAVVGRTVGIDQILGALLLYRLIYHLLPLVLAAVLVTGFEVRRAVSRSAGSRLMRAGARLSPRVLSALTLVLGAILIFSSVTPASDEALDAIAQVFPLPIVESAHFLASILGLGLLIVARGLAFRLDGAWWAAVVAISLAIVLSLVKALALIEAVLLIFLLVALFATRREFSRPASLIHQALTPLWLAAIATVIITALAVFFFAYRDVEYTNELWWQFEFSAEAPRGLRALLGVILSAGLVGGWSLLRPAAARPLPPTDEEMDLAMSIVDRQSVADANLVRMRDKSLMFSDDKRAFIMYGCQGRSWVALFDPIGAPEAWPALIWRFVEMARGAGGRAAFYQVAPENLSLYADAGLRAFKIGEEARIDLRSFDLKGAKRAGLRNSANRGTRDGFEFAVVQTNDVPLILDELERVSNAWLSQHTAREKGFSLGAFDREYVSSQPVAIVRLNNRIVAFATVLVTATRVVSSIDLMRFDETASKAAMEFLFVKLIEYLKAEGHQWFSLGMAPLAGLSASPAAPVWHRAARTIFEHGERFYNFRGLRAFKNKFSPDWLPRYMAVQGGINPMLALADTTMLIGGGLKGIVSK